jgi:Calpain family cysteine protease
MGWQPNGTLDTSKWKGYWRPAPAPVKAEATWIDTSFNTHVDLTGPLFAHEPTITDINQENIGDCWFLAALAAILRCKDGSDAIQGMMRDHGDGTVSVRLYEKRGTKFDAIVVHIAKSVVWTVRPNKVWHASGANWVMLLEKALTYFAKDGHYSPHDASYGRVEANSVTVAFSALLGAESFAVPISLSPETKARKALDDLLAGRLQSSKPGDAGVLSDVLSSVVEISAPSCTALLENWAGSVQGRRPVGEAWAALVAEKQGRKAKVVKDTSFSLSDPSTWTKSYEDVANPDLIRFEDFVKFMDDHANQPHLPLPPPIKDAIVRWVERNRMFAGKRGTGFYDADALLYFETIEYQLKSGLPLTLSTRKYVGTSTTKGHSAAEDISKGLAGNHAYAVLDVARDPQGRRYVQIYNPWGFTGREYSFLLQQDPRAVPSDPAANASRIIPTFQGGAADPRARRTGSGTFWLELSDVTKRCNTLCYCGTAPAKK